ncbi:MAG: ferredoxin:thioredoxin reductase [Spirochaetes bacterium]|nr:ferredoxin:thioredoxin reductase [Spirochaetota bacterium]
MKQKSLEDVRLFTVMAAVKQGWVLNADQGFYDILAQGLCDNFNRYGYFLCPCRDTDGSRLADKDSICPCLWSKSDIPEYGHCYCALYLSQNFVDSNLAPSSIPDRRYG